MRIGELFAGIGGFSIAAHSLGWSTAWVSEIDPFRRILEMEAQRD